LLQLLRGMLHRRRWRLLARLARRSERLGLRSESH
jgi:hypothetical protein